MMLRSLLFSCIIASTAAAPAVVWNGAEQHFLHSSEEITASKVLDNVLDGQPSKDQSSLAAVIFVIGRGEDGSESLTQLASSGKLSQTSEKYNDASGIFHHVSGIESTQTVVDEAARANPDHNVMEVSLDEFNSKMGSLNEPIEMEVSEIGSQIKSTSKSVSRRARHLANADVLVVNVGAKADTSTLDNAINNAVESKKVNAVVLTGIRSLSEVKHERYLLTKRRMDKMEEEGKRVLAARRRLEQEDNGENNGNANNGNNDLSGVYYVNMTPNIFAAILFGLLFVVVTIIGVSCMGAIAGQDVYVSKLPVIGREA